MGLLKNSLRLLCYNDAATTNDPQYVNFDYSKEWSEATVRASSLELSCATGDTAVSVGTGNKWLAILCDQNIVVKLNGSVDTSLTVRPSVAGTQDGFLLIRCGVLSSLTINVPGATSANVKVFFTS